MLVKKKFTNTS